MSTQRKPIVYVCDWKPHHSANSKNLSEYGDIRPLFKDGRLNVWKLQAEVETVEMMLRQNKFEPEVDFIAVLGSPINSAIVFMAVASMMPAVHQINLLFFDATKQQYRLQVVNL